MKDFVHLHTHSHYSLLNALPKIPELVKKTKSFGMKSLAITDNGNLYGAIDFYKTCKKEGIKPIIGIDAYLSARTRHDKQAGADARRNRLILLAKNKVGYGNLIKLVTASFLEGFYYKPRLDKELLEKYSEGLVAISPSFSGDISVFLKNSDHSKAKEITDWYQGVFGKENFFLEITKHPEINGHNEKMNSLIEFAKEVSLPLCGANDVYYMNPEDKLARQTLLSVQTNGEREIQNENEDFSFISQERANELFADIPEALENTIKISDTCNLELELGKWVFPDFKIPIGKDHSDVLREEALKGVQKRNFELNSETEKRINYELEVIKNKGYSPYFLVVSDLLRFAKENRIFSNTRGSAAGSLISYLIGITNVDPIRFRLPFERFLNPERPSAPDIDMDLADDRRDEVIQYARQKYGEKNVAQIGTFGTMMARGSIRDTARAMGFPYALGDRIAKLIPMGAQGFPMTIDKAMETEAELESLYKKDSESKEIIDMARKIEGCARHISVHAAGVVISPKPLTDFVPLQFDPKGGKIITQYDMHSVEDAGLLKFDFLGLKNLTIMANTARRIRKIYGKDLDTDTIPLDDKKTFDMLARGETIATFQLNGQGMTRFLKELKPSIIDDINAMVALYRPGPMEFIPDYISRKHNPKLATYLDPRLKNILEQTFGIIIYQDDVLLIATQIAGYSWGEADKFRKAMGKKIPEEMQSQKEKFTKGCISGGLSPEKTQKLWDMIETFAAYGFNKAHAASYGRIAYLTSYLKANFPVAYMSSVLTSDSGEVEKIAEMINECKRMKISVLPPDINESFEDFAVIRDEETGSEKIRFGLVTIKNFGEGIATAIINERKKSGKFLSLADFLKRIKDRNLNKKSLEALIKSGALDAFGERGEMISNIDELLNYAKESREMPLEQDCLFGIETEAKITLKKSVPATVEEKLSWEKELLGLYVSGHPLDKFKNKLENREANIAKAKKQVKAGATIVITGIIEEIKEINTKKGDKMMFLKISDYSDSIETVVFPKILEENKEIILPEKCVAVKGKISDRNGEISLILDKIKLMK